MSARRSIKRSNKSKRKSAIKAAILNPKVEENQMKLPAPLDLLGRPIPPDEPRMNQRVTVMEEPKMDLPELWLSVYVHGPEAGPSFNRLFARCKCLAAPTPDEADLVVFTGSGHDIDPQLYGETPHKKTYLFPKRDEENLKLYHFCRQRGIPMFGVCGGAQLLHVANGGMLFQDIDGHQGAHSMWALRSKEMIQSVSSVHHQACRPNNKMEILGTAHTSRERWKNGTECEKGNYTDIEAFWYKDVCAFGVQGHPEYSGYAYYTTWTMQMLDVLINQNPDLAYRANGVGTNRLRIREELLETRQASKVYIPAKDDAMIIVEPVAKG